MNEGEEEDGGGGVEIEGKRQWQRCVCAHPSDLKSLGEILRTSIGHRVQGLGSTPCNRRMVLRSTLHAP